MEASVVISAKICLYNQPGQSDKRAGHFNRNIFKLGIHLNQNWVCPNQPQKINGSVIFKVALTRQNIQVIGFGNHWFL